MVHGAWCVYYVAADEGWPQAGSWLASEPGEEDAGKQAGTQTALLASQTYCLFSSSVAWVLR